LSLYSSVTDAFSEDHLRIIEAVARQIAHTLRSALDFDRLDRRDELTGLPSLKQLEDLIKAGKASTLKPLSLVLIDVIDLKDTNARHGRAAGDDVLRHVVRQARAALRVADILFRSSSDELIALLTGTKPDTATVVATRIRDTIKENPVVVRGAKVYV